MGDLKPKETLREVLIVATPVNEEHEIDRLSADVSLQDKAIAKITNMFLGNLDDINLDDVDDFAVEAFGDDWGADGSGVNDAEDTIKILGANELDAEPVRPDLIEKLQKELDTLRSQHEFECEYVDQLEQEIISITHDRDRQVQELTTQLEKLQNQHLQEITKKDQVIHQLQNDNNALEISQRTLTEELENTHRLLQECTKAAEIVQSKLIEVTAHRDQIEEKLIQHLANPAHLQQSLRGLENECVNDLTRVQHSEQQIEELQEQVLRQASKAAEYEAAIQHWKEQSVRHQHHSLQLSAALDRLLAEKPLKHLIEASSHSHNEIRQEQEYPSRRSSEATSESFLELNPEKSPERSFRPNSKVDLPAFLVRHR